VSQTEVVTQFSAPLGRSLFNFAYVADIFACRSRNGVLLHVCVCYSSIIHEALLPAVFVPVLFFIESRVCALREKSCIIEIKFDFVEVYVQHCSVLSSVKRVICTLDGMAHFTALYSDDSFVNNMKCKLLHSQ